MILTILLTGLLGTTAQAQEQDLRHPDYYKLRPYKLTKIADEPAKLMEIPIMNGSGDCNSEAVIVPELPKDDKKPIENKDPIPPKSNARHPEAEVYGWIENALQENPVPGWDLSQIFNLAQKAWEFIQNNKPVIQLQTTSANALPRGAKCWTDLANWQVPRSEVYSVEYENLMGMKVVSMQFRLLYAFGGSKDGVGKYLTNSTIQFKSVKAVSGFRVDANVNIPTVLNIGSASSPIAGMQLDLIWKVSGLFNVEQNTAGFFVAGDGRPTRAL